MTVTATKPHPIFLAGRWVQSPDVLEVTNPAQAAQPAGATYNATAALESGKPIRDALIEVDRAVLTFRLGAEEAERGVAIGAV